MGSDRNFYCDFNSHLLGEWNFKSGDNRIDTDFVLEQAQNIILGIDIWGGDDSANYILDQETFENSWARSETAYMSTDRLLKAFKHALAAGKHVLSLECQGQSNVRIYIHKLDKNRIKHNNKIQDEVINYPELQTYSEQHKEKDLTDYQNGVGDGIQSIGRFGFTKGDGILDCAMTTLGNINRMYPFGHPDYKKITRWQYSVLPKNLAPETQFHGSFPPAQVDIENDDIDITYLSVKWAALLNKKMDQQINYSCTYSLASAGIMVNSNDDLFTLSDLQYTANYKKILLPLEKGLTVRDISSSDDLYDRLKDGELKENWFMIYGADTFPDVPIQVVLQKKTDLINAEYDGEKLDSIDIKSGDVFGKAFLVSPFGIELFNAGATLNNDFIVDAYKRCNFWSRAVLAYPVDVKEFYKIDSDSENVEVVQKFTYKFIDDEWGTIPLKTAALPPTLSILDDDNKLVNYSDDIVDFQFPTKYGYLKGVVGSDTASYTIPFMPSERIFPFKNSKKDKISQLLSEDLEDYFSYHEKFDTTVQATPFSGACTESYAWTSSLGNYMSVDDRKRIAIKALERLTAACNPNGEYEYPIVNHADFMSNPPDKDRVLEIYSNPDLKYITLHNWYWRQEPLTGIKYRICYLNVCMFYNGEINSGTRQEVFDFKDSLIENDWGMGVSFYAMYLSALASGDFTPIKENWQTLCDAFKYFETYHDWACMGSAYCEDGRTWVEGAAYGAFTSFINMAEAAGDKQTHAKMLYLNAKQMSLRLSIFRSSYTYFYKFFNHKPWYITKCFHDEAGPSAAFQNVPILEEDIYRYSGVFNLTTEGLFLETFMMLNKFIPNELVYLSDLTMKIYETEKPQYWAWTKEQENCSCLLANAVNENLDKAKCLENIEKLEKRGFLIKKWRAMHSFSRLLPKHYLRCLIMGLLENREHPAWLEFWHGVEIQKAEYNPDIKEVEISFKLLSKPCLIRLGIRTSPKQILLNDNKINISIKNSKLTINPSESGIINITFQ